MHETDADRRPLFMFRHAGPAYISTMPDHEMAEKVPLRNWCGKPFSVMQRHFLFQVSYVCL